MEQSYWLKNCQSLNLQAVKSNINIDIAIVGGGITGMMLAYYLMPTKSSFLVVEADEVGYGASGRSTGKITSQHALCYHYFLSTLGEEKAKAYYDANEEAIDSIESIIKEHNIDCDFTRVNGITYTNREENKQMIEDEIDACRRLGIPCEEVTTSEYPIPFAKGIEFANQAQFNPLVFLQGLAKLIIDKGHTIYEHSPVKEIEKDKDGYILYVNDYQIHAKQVVLATQFPFIDDSQLYFAKLFNEQSRLYCSQVDFNSNTQLISDDEDVFSYRTFKDQHPYLLFGSNHHRVASPTKEKNFLNDSIEQFQLQNEIINWSSQDYYTADRLPLIGRLNKRDQHLFFASGYQKWGNTLGCVAAKLLCALLLDQKSQYTMMFDPHRSGLLMNTTALKENSKTALALLLGKLEETSDELPTAGQASTVLIEGKVYGVYKDENNHVHTVDITCPHMGCTLVFNTSDKTWDCPCHGSRFHYNGEIIRGPASTNLQKVGDNNKINPHVWIKKKP